MKVYHNNDEMPADSPFEIGDKVSTSGLGEVFDINVITRRDDGTWIVEGYNRNSENIISEASRCTLVRSQR